jgi:diguanylate cyclase (GGDEF)-like protein/putative nucleotidyltransferase with HDIG domain/PAS domain S-box-containing protein
MSKSSGLDILSPAFIDEMPLVIVGFDSRGKVTHWNRQAETSTGYSREDALSRGITAFLALFGSPGASPTSIPEAFNYLRQVLDGKISINGREMSLLSGDGCVRYIKWYGHVISREDGIDGLELVLTGVDMTDSRILHDTIREREKYIRTATRRLKKFISLDPQTVLLNYRHFIVELNNIFLKSRESAAPLALLMVDIDNFNSVNCAYGTVEGNHILRELADLIREGIDKRFIAARFSGTEFAVLMPETDIKTAHQKAARIYETISEHDFGSKDGKMKVLLSLNMVLGGYPHCEDIATAEQLVGRVTDKMEEVKRTGATGVVICPPNGLIGEEGGLISTSKGEGYRYTVDFVNALAKAVKSKDCYTQEHSSAMSDYAVSIAEEMGMKKDAVRDVMFGSILHDVGKIGIDKFILLKPDTLTDGEFSIIKQHPRIGAEIIRSVRPLKRVVPLVLYHHERYDGGGYLNGLRAEEIPLGARIISLADVFQALTSDRPYRKALSEDDALAIIEEYSGKHFDPNVVKAFFEIHNSRK